MEDVYLLHSVCHRSNDLVVYRGTQPQSLTGVFLCLHLLSHTMKGIYVKGEPGPLRSPYRQEKAQGDFSPWVFRTHTPPPHGVGPSVHIESSPQAGPLSR
jgi:hypothetical protein